MRTAELMAAEVKWYRKHGKWPERILHDSKGQEYVAGDWSWNRGNPDKQEDIEHKMYHFGIYKED